MTVCAMVATVQDSTKMGVVQISRRGRLLRCRDQGHEQEEEEERIEAEAGAGAVTYLDHAGATLASLHAHRRGERGEEGAARLQLEPHWPSEVQGAAAVKVSEARQQHLRSWAEPFPPCPPANSSSSSSSSRESKRGREVFLWTLDASKLASTSAIDLSGQGVPPRASGAA